LIRLDFVDIDLSEPYNIEKVIDNVKPDEFYNLAAQSFVGLSFEQPQVTTITNSLGVLNILEVLRNKHPNS
jgi:GDPmannose 4,6-dehydratase